MVADFPGQIGREEVIVIAYFHPRPKEFEDVIHRGDAVDARVPIIDKAAGEQEVQEVVLPQQTGHDPIPAQLDDLEELVAVAFIGALVQRTGNGEHLAEEFGIHHHIKLKAHADRAKGAQRIVAQAVRRTHPQRFCAQVEESIQRVDQALL